MYLARGTLITIFTLLINASDEAFIGASSGTVESNETFSVAKEDTSIHYGCCQNDTTPFCKG